MLTALLTDTMPIASMYHGVRQAMSGSESAQRAIEGFSKQGVSSAKSTDAYSLQISDEGKAKAKQASSGKELTEEEQATVEELRTRDREVRQHEQAHVAAAGGYAKGGPKFDYQKGPDGRQYAIGGHVNLDTSKENTPEESIRKASILKKAALAPGDPSGQDRSVAAQAAQMEAEARMEKSQEVREDAVPGKVNDAYRKNGVSVSKESSFSWVA